MQLVALSGSPSARSRSAWLLQLAQTRLEAVVRQASTLTLRDLPAQPLLAADAQHPAIQAALQSVAQADVVLVATPIYKAAYSGLLKTFLDLLPAEALRDKIVLPLATGGSSAHLLALDYALKPVLCALGARSILDGVFAADAQLVAHEAGGYVPDAALLRRLDRALAPLLERAAPRPEPLRCSA
ncbi:MAG TPA: NADPH-dependent FMN reductase [Rubrivivax sp.]|nr:NADPH-dependent FMN reductase [Rubrivivax sp.]